MKAGTKGKSYFQFIGRKKTELESKSFVTEIIFKSLKRTVWVMKSMHLSDDCFLEIYLATMTFMNQE